LNDLCVTPHDDDRRALPTLRLCSSCRRQLERLIADMPGLYADLGRALATTGSAGQRVSGSAAEPLPINPAVADHRSEMHHGLVSWCVYVADARGIELPTSSEPAVTAAWLTTHAEWLAGDRAAAEECLPVMRALAGRARALLYPSGSKRIAIGPCCEVIDETVSDARCCGTLYATVRAEDDARPSAIYCDTCEFYKAPEEWLRFGREYLRERMAS
jgi:hypothetical protein